MGIFRRRFEPDGQYNGVQYRATKGGGVDALFGRTIKKFGSIEEFIAAASPPDPFAAPPASEEPFSSPPAPAPAPSLSAPASAPTPLASVPPPKPVSKGNGCGCFVVFILGIVVVIAILANQPTTTGPTAGYSGAPLSSAASRMVDVINNEFGGVCTAKLEGFWSDTLRIDWRASTTKLHSMMIFAAIGKSKETLYGAGIRYLKFPNDAGGYNIIDWKTGEKTSISERPPYGF